MLLILCLFQRDPYQRLRGELCKEFLVGPYFKQSNTELLLLGPSFRRFRNFLFILFVPILQSLEGGGFLKFLMLLTYFRHFSFLYQGGFFTSIMEPFQITESFKAPLKVPFLFFIFLFYFLKAPFLSPLGTVFQIIENFQGE